MPKRGPLIFLAVLLAALLPFLLQVAWPFLTSFILAAILSIVMNPVKEWLNARLHRPGVACLLTTLGTVLVIGTVFAWVVFTITGELAAAYSTLNQRSLEEGGWPALVAHTADRAVDALATRLPMDKAAIRTELMERMKSASGFLLKNTGAALGGVTDVLLTGLMVAIFLYFLLKYGKDWIRRLSALTPLDARTCASILTTVEDSVIANVNGVFAAAVGQGLFLGLGFWIVGLRSPALWGAVGGLASIVPVVGAPLVWVPVMIAYIVLGAYWKALLLGLWGALIVGSIDNILRPFVVGAREKQNPVLIALAAIGGAYALGPLGILLGPLMVSLASALLIEIQKLLPPSDSPGDELFDLHHPQHAAGDGERTSPVPAIQPHGSKGNL